MKGQATTNWAKLDGYQYILKKDSKKDLYDIYILVDSIDDPEIADISTLITSNDGNIYLEGLYLRFKDIQVIKMHHKTYVYLITTKSKER